MLNLNVFLFSAIICLTIYFFSSRTFTNGITARGLIRMVPSCIALGAHVRSPMRMGCVATAVKWPSSAANVVT